MPATKQGPRHRSQHTRSQPVRPKYQPPVDAERAKRLWADWTDPLTDTEMATIPGFPSRSRLSHWATDEPHRLPFYLLDATARRMAEKGISRDHLNKLSVYAEETVALALRDRPHAEGRVVVTAGQRADADGDVALIEVVEDWSRAKIDRAISALRVEIATHRAQLSALIWARNEVGT